VLFLGKKHGTLVRKNQPVNQNRSEKKPMSGEVEAFLKREGGKILVLFKGSSKPRWMQESTFQHPCWDKFKRAMEDKEAKARSSATEQTIPSERERITAAVMLCIGRVSCDDAKLKRLKQQLHIMSPTPS